jgi:DNA-binding YbaB/EbfC family protein
MGSGFSKMKKQARLMQDQMEKMREQLKTTTVVGKSEGDLVTMTFDGERKLLSIKIQPECVDKNDIEGLQDLIQSAYTDACKQLDELSSEDPSQLLNFNM